jgi:hypothetical protein
MLSPALVVPLAFTSSFAFGPDAGPSRGLTMAFILDRSMRKMFPPEVIFQFYYDADVPGCWKWRGVRNGDGYGKFLLGNVDGRPVLVLAHRYQYEMLYGPIPEGMQIDHCCKNILCINPSHLEAVTPRENNRRSDSLTAQNGRKTHCLRGHPFAGDNLRLRGDGRRTCHACRLIRKRMRGQAALPIRYE